MGTYRIKVAVKGTRPLLQNQFRVATEGPPKKGQVYDDEMEVKQRLIIDDKGKICQPALHFEAAMIKSAAEFKFQGRKTFKDLFKAAVFIEPMLIPHKLTRYVIDRQAVVIAKARIIRCRPRFDKWELYFTILVNDDRIQPLVVKQILENAGKYHGIGDYRPRFGLFTVSVFQPAV